MGEETLTEQGVEIAERIADCYVEVDIERNYDSADDCLAMARSSGFEPIGSGLSRDVFVLDPELVTGDRECVIKIPTRLLGTYENLREVRHWNELPDAVRRHLAPVLDHGLEWIVVPRAEQDLTSAEILSLWADLTDTGWACEDANWAHNLGRIDGRPVILDYGGGFRRI